MSEPPSTPRKPSKPPSQAWADMVDDMDTMPVDQAKRLKPSDVGVKFGPIMDEHQFREYCSARPNRTHVIQTPKK